MINPNDPPRGSMYLYDDITPPTVDGSYSISISTNISYEGQQQSAPIQRKFDVVGPRFTLDPTVVVNVYPPRNGQGTYQDAVPQAVLKRRTLPWERRIDSDSNVLGTRQGGGIPINGAVPWVALLLFEEGEYAILQGQKLEDVVPAKTFKDLGSPQNILCDAVEADAQLIHDILPSREELQLLCHVRQVNVEDRELSAGSSDGFFSVVMSNRLPAPDSKCRACLVSLEQRTDLVQPNAPAFEYPGIRPVVLGVADSAGLTPEPAASAQPAVPTPVAPPVTQPASPLRFGSETASGAARLANIGNIVIFQQKVRLVLLHSWQFTVTGPGTFRTLMQHVDVGMIGKVKQVGKPALTDTGHLQLPVLDRAGETEITWYRGPLVPWQLTRDPLGPYHSADQCRRVTPETGAEDVSYAAAFEVGRQLASADARLAQELMRWRRESYKQSARADTISQVQNAIAVDLPAALEQKLQVPLAPILSVSAAQVLVSGAPPVADRFGIDAASKTLGMTAENLSQAWNLGSPAEAEALLGSDPATLGAPIASPEQTPRPNVTLTQVAADAASLHRLGTLRELLLETAKIQVANAGEGDSR